MTHADFDRAMTLVVTALTALHGLTDVRAAAAESALTDLRDAVTAQDEQIAALDGRLSRHQDRAIVAAVRRVTPDDAA